MSSADSTSAGALVTSPPNVSVENEWVSELCECFTYRTEAEKLRFSPIFMPCTCFCPCVMLGRIKSRLISEPLTGCCHMGHRGRCFCLASCCLCPCLPLFSLNVRQKAMAMNNVPGGCCEEWKGLCCACSLFQVYVSLDEWDLVKKGLTKTSSAKKKEEMRLKAQKMKEKKSKKEELPPIPTQLNDITELVMTYMGDIMDDDEDDLSDDDDDLSDEEVEEYDNNDLSDKSKTNTNGKYNAIPTDSRESSHMPTRIDVVQVTIPPGHFEGSIFQIENNKGEILEVVVPPGGKPGMKMQVPNHWSPPTPPPPPQNQQIPHPSPVGVPDGTIHVVIPPNHYAGSIFCIQSSNGEVMEIKVPVGGQPGMKMQIPNNFSKPQQQSQSQPAPMPNRQPPVPVTQTPPAPPGIKKKKSSNKKIKRQRSGSPKRSTAADGSKKIQVTIPEGCGPGDIFELEPVSSRAAAAGRHSENIKVRVPPGGRPGMRVLIRLPSLTPPSPEQQQPQQQQRKQEQKKSKEKPLRKQQPVMRESPRNKDKVTRHAYGSMGGGGKPIPRPPTATVTIPSGVTVGEPFMAVDINSGNQVLVIVPPGAKPGMVVAANIVEDIA